MQKLKDHSLYLVITEEYGNGRSACEIAEAAIKGGADIIQMREKDRPRAEITGLGRKLSRICKDAGVIFIVNDDPELAKEVGADGVHLGQEDMKKHSLEKARKILGGNSIIGVSTHSLAQFDAANREAVDYIAFGPVFPTKVKDFCAGTKDIEEILKMARKTVFFIGGITLENVGQLLKKRAKNISLIRDILQSEDIGGRTRLFKEKLKT